MDIWWTPKMIPIADLVAPADRSGSKYSELLLQAEASESHAEVLLNLAAIIMLQVLDDRSGPEINRIAACANGKKMKFQRTPKLRPAQK
jgi:hypothetical protein